ncbi:hypothetical protein FM036_39275, partial [Nostoc sp. HG1]|nr:hypothetical protein [Nostoc sp. HG1]
EDVQRLWNLVKDDLKPDRLLNVAIGILTDLSREGAAAILPKLHSLLLLLGTSQQTKSKKSLI